jgi:hypothetical protein
MTFRGVDEVSILPLLPIDGEVLPALRFPIIRSASVRSCLVWEKDVSGFPRLSIDP